MSDLYKNKYRTKSIRAQWWDYRWNAAYFITICTKNRAWFFGEIDNNRMNRSKIGDIAHSCWAEIPKHFPFVYLGEFVVMPNHVHGIVIIQNEDERRNSLQLDSSQPDSSQPVEALHATPPLVVGIKDEKKGDQDQKNEKMASISPKSGSLSAIIRSYKSAVTKNSRLIRRDFAWQSLFYDHIIRNEEAFENISEYIITNPLRWAKDKFYNS